MMSNRPTKNDQPLDLAVNMDATDRQIINCLQLGMPVCEQPYAAVAREIGLSEEALLLRLSRLTELGVISRLGPMYHAEKLGGGLTLAAMQVPAADFERVAQQVNEFAEVAHNYQRDHVFNMWFVLATETPAEIEQVLAAIRVKTQCAVFNMPKLEEFFVGLTFKV